MNMSSYSHPAWIALLLGLTLGVLGTNADMSDIGDEDKVVVINHTTESDFRTGFSRMYWNTVDFPQQNGLAGSIQLESLVPKTEDYILFLDLVNDGIVEQI